MSRRLDVPGPKKGTKSSLALPKNAIGEFNEPAQSTPAEQCYSDGVQYQQPQQPAEHSRPAQPNPVKGRRSHNPLKFDTYGRPDGNTASRAPSSSNQNKMAPKQREQSQASGSAARSLPGPAYPPVFGSSAGSDQHLWSHLLQPAPYHATGAGGVGSQQYQIPSPSAPNFQDFSVDDPVNQVGGLTAESHQIWDATGRRVVNQSDSTDGYLPSPIQNISSQLVQVNQPQIMEAASGTAEDSSFADRANFEQDDDEPSEPPQRRPPQPFPGTFADKNAAENDKLRKLYAAREAYRLQKGNAGLITDPVEQIRWVKDIFEAIGELDNVIDLPQGNGDKALAVAAFERDEWSAIRREAVSWQIFTLASDKFIGVELLENAPFEEEEFATLQDHLTALIVNLRTVKAAGKHLLDPDYICRFVNAPEGELKRQKTNAKANAKRAARKRARKEKEEREKAEALQNAVVGGGVAEALAEVVKAPPQTKGRGKAPAKPRAPKKTTPNTVGKKVTGGSDIAIGGPSRAKKILNSMASDDEEDAVQEYSHSSALHSLQPQESVPPTHAGASRHLPSSPAHDSYGHGFPTPQQLSGMNAFQVQIPRPENQGTYTGQPPFRSPYHPPVHNTQARGTSNPTYGFISSNVPGSSMAREPGLQNDTPVPPTPHHLSDPALLNSPAVPQIPSIPSYIINPHRGYPDSLFSHLQNPGFEQAAERAIARGKPKTPEQIAMEEAALDEQHRNILEGIERRG